MKDYIYVDTDLATSYFAQMNQGAITKTLFNNENSELHTTNGGEQSKKNTKAGVTSGVTIAHDHEKTEIDTFSNAILKNNTETVENVLHDYLIDILLNSISSKSIDEAEDGDFIIHKGKVKIYDFETSKETVTSDFMRAIHALSDNSKDELNELNRLENKSRKTKISVNEEQKIAKIKGDLGISGIELAEGSFKVLDRLFPETILIKVGNTVSLCDKTKFRLPRNHLSPLNSSTREITVFGRTLSKVSQADTEIPTSSLEILSKASILFPEIITSNFEIKKDGDYNIRPIAIYFE
jgi:hypothetical protein